MTNQQHPITPPQELIDQWIRDANHNEPMFAQVAIMGAHWGADQELEACVEWTRRDSSEEDAVALRAARRPKPPSLKEQALAELEILSDYAHGLGCSESAIRRALELLPS